MKARELVASSMRKIGALGQGDVLSAGDLKDGLSALNSMLDSWSAEGLLIPAKTREEFLLTPGVSDYTMGASADFDTARPVSIDFAAILVENGVQSFETPVGILNDREWAEERIKSFQSDFPRWVHISRSAPNWLIKLWPVPASSHKLVLYSEKPLLRLASETEVTALEGYERALIYNLAIEIAPEYEREPSATVVATANSSKSTIMSRNSGESTLTCDSATLSGGGRHSIYSGDT